MAEFLMTDGINRKLTEIIASAKSHLIFISPYLKLSPFMTTNIFQAANSNVKIRVLYGKVDLDEQEKQSLQSMPNLQLFFLQNLHAKCYMSESQLLVTSMNLYEYSQNHNSEMGIAMDSIKDKELFAKAYKEAERLFSASEQVLTPQYLNPHQQSQAQRAKLISVKPQPAGFCIRCSSPIAHNPDRPLCTSCYSVWNQWGDPDYEENFCHTCGDVDDISVSSPQCYDCYSSMNGRQRFGR